MISEGHNNTSRIINNTSFFNLTLTWSHRNGASSPAARGEPLLCPWWIASSSGLTGDSICLSPLKRSSVWINLRTLSTDSRVPQMLPLIPSGARMIPPETRWRDQLGEVQIANALSISNRALIWGKWQTMNRIACFITETNTITDKIYSLLPKFKHHSQRIKNADEIQGERNINTKLCKRIREKFFQKNKPLTGKWEDWEIAHTSSWQSSFKGFLSSAWSGKAANL